MPTYTDDQLTAAVAGAHSWRGVLRLLGLPPQSSSALRSARRTATRLGLDVSHFTGQRRWSDRQLAEAVAASRDWAEVLDRLGLARTSGSSRALLSTHAVRLRIPVDHLAATPSHDAEPPFTAPAQLHHLPRTGPLPAASWFTMRGYEVAWPLEPARYDLVVTDSSRSYRIQVKTTTSKAGGSWSVRISSTAAAVPRSIPPRRSTTSSSSTATSPAT